MSDLLTLQKDLQHQRELLKQLEAKHASQQAKLFTGLPAQYGFGSIDQLILALVPYASPRMKGRFKTGPKAAATAPARAKSPKPKGKRRRAAISDETRNAVIEAIKAGEKTGAAIAKEFGISVPSVNNIKAAAKLTKPRKSK